MISENINKTENEHNSSVSRYVIIDINVEYNLLGAWLNVYLRLLLIYIKHF